MAKLSPGQQCTYDANGKLITAGIAAGSPDKASPKSCGYSDFINSVGIFIGCNSSQHCIQDVQPWMTGNATTIPCWQYLRDWPVNNKLGCVPNKVSDIEHMKTMIGNMTCEEATLLIKKAKETGFPVIDADLRKFIIGEPVTLSNADIKIRLQNWRTVNLCPSFPTDPLCIVLNKAIANMP